MHKKYVALSEQCLNNWEPCKDMWVAFYRRDLPTYGDNTNNRVERSFWTLKQSIEDRFRSTPTIHQSIIHLISFCEERIMQGTSHAVLKSLVIYDADARISALNHIAALVLNERGCTLFHQSLTALQKRREL